MPTPLKDKKMRQRRNKDVTAATLVDESPIQSASHPEMPALSTFGREGVWHPFVVKYWTEIWASAMASEYTTADVHGLVMLMDLQDRYWKGDTDLAAEIRLQRQCFGLTSLDRKRLQWEIKRVEKPGRAEAPKRPERLADPRSVLKSVS